MEIRVTVEINGLKYGQIYSDAEHIPAKEFGLMVEDTINKYRGYSHPAKSLVEDNDDKT